MICFWQDTRLCNVSFMDLPANIHSFIADVRGMTYEHLAKIMTGEERAIVVTGFGLTGRPHLGTKLLIQTFDCIIGESNKGVIFLSGKDALARSTEDEHRVRSQGAIEKLLHSTLTHNRNVSLKYNDFSSISPLIHSLELKVKDCMFRDAYQTELSEFEKNAVIDMAASILEYMPSSEDGMIVLIGIDELDNLLFVEACAKVLGMEPPAFVLVKTIRGYDGGKMGKSREGFSLLVTESVEKEVAKIKQFLQENHTDDEFCPLCDIYANSTYAKSFPNLTQKDVHDAVSEIIACEVLGNTEFIQK